MTEVGMELLRLSNIKKEYGALAVLRGVSLSVQAGEVVAIIGPSGSGKSTLLRCATMLERIESGEIFYGDLAAARMSSDGRVVCAEGTDRAAIRRRFGMVFQDFNLFPHFTVLRNVSDAPVKVQKKSRAEAEATARVLLARMGLAGRELEYPNRLSGGQQQRVSIARALALEPDILFFDEPTSSLDPELTGEILSVIRDLAAEHRTMVIVTHEIAFAKNVADRIIFMDEGMIVEEGTPDAVIGRPSQPRTQAFLGRMLRI